MKKIRNIVLILALLSVISLVSFRLGETKAVRIVDTNGQLDLSLMWQVKDKLTKTYLDISAMKNQDMVYGAIEGMVASLGDPYTVFLPPKENKSSQEDLAGEFGGVGISLGYKDKTLAVMTPLPKTPAERAGIMAGDLILKIIDKAKEVDRETSGISLDEAVNLIRGKIGTQVTLKLFREGKTDTFDVTLTRENIVVPSLEMEWLTYNGKKIAWLKLYKFTELLYKEWPEVVKKMKSEMSSDFGGIVLDLRNNPGGFLQASVMVGSDFIDSGVIVEQQSADGSIEEYKVDQNMGNLLTEKMVVLVNGGSASAAEILAGALKEYSRAKLVGEKTFGKGTVQQPEQFKDGSGLHVTIAKWLLPSGKNIHKEGVMPDVEVKYEVPTGDAKVIEKMKPLEKDNQLKKAVETLL